MIRTAKDVGIAQYHGFVHERVSVLVIKQHTSITVTPFEKTTYNSLAPALVRGGLSEN